MELDKLSFMIKELSVSLFTELHPTDKSILGSSLEDLLETNPEQSIKNFKLLYKSLNSSQTSIKNSKIFSQFSEVEGYQKALQKLDSEIRNHIKHELQMKVFIDTLDEKIKLRKGNKNKDFKEKVQDVAGLEEENLKIKRKIEAVDKEIEELEMISKGSEEFEVVFLREKVNKENEKVADLEKQGLRLVQKCTNAKIELDFLARQYEKLKDEFLALKSAIAKNDNARSLSRSNERKDLGKESFDIKLKNSVTPTPEDRSISPVPLSIHQKIRNIGKSSSNSRRAEFNPLRKILVADQSQSKLKASNSFTSKKK